MFFFFFGMLVNQEKQKINRERIKKNLNYVKQSI